MKVVILGLFAALVFLACPISAGIQSPILMAVYLVLAMPAGAAALAAVQLRRERR